MIFSKVKMMKGQKLNRKRLTPLVLRVLRAAKRFVFEIPIYTFEPFKKVNLI